MRKDPSLPRPQVPKVARSNIEAITRIEEEYLRQRSGVDLLGDTISRLAGSIWFVVIHVFVFAAWILANIHLIPGLAPFDPFPFGLLSLVVALEAIFLSTFVLMSQNRQAHQADHWAHLDLQIGLLAEHETTKVLQMLKAVCSHLGLDKQARDTELDEMVGKTSVGELAEKLAEKLESTRDQQQPHPAGR